jgi:hypothetical protein
VEGFWKGTDVKQVRLRSVRQAQELPRQRLPEIGGVGTRQVSVSCLVAVTNGLSLLAKIIVSWLENAAEILDQRDFQQYKCGAKRVRVLT